MPSTPRSSTPDQQPLGPGFGATSTTTDVLAGVDLTGKVAIVTGGYSGIGIPAATALADAGAQVIVPARDLEKARRTLGDHPGMTLEQMDLLDPDSIDAFANRVLAQHPAVHLLLNSAGIMASPLTRDARGYESQFATNHLGHFQLTTRLWPALANAANSGGARIVAVSSMGHHFAPVDLDDPHFETTPYDPWGAYGRAKTANVLFAVEADRRGRDQGIRAFAVHPGRIFTDIARFMTTEQLIGTGTTDEQGNPIFDPAAGSKTPEQGAATGVWALTSPRLDGVGGLYAENCDLAVIAVHEAVDNNSYGVNPWALDPETAERLWTLSENLTGARLPDLSTPS